MIIINKKEHYTMEIIKLGSKGDKVKQIQKVVGVTADGDFGPKTEAAVKEWQKKNGLTADGLVGAKTWEKMFGSTPASGWVGGEVVYNPINIHITKKKRTIKYLVIHFTAGSKSTKGSANGTRTVFLNRQASADFAVDDVTMLQINPDPLNYYCWAVGDGKGPKTITNTNSISIEICSSLKPGTSVAVANHSGWYFTEAALANAAKLAKLLMKKYNIPIINVVRHYDATGKYCPGILGWNDGIIYDTAGKKTKDKNNSSEWLKFKNRLL